MSGPSMFGTPRRWRRGATLTLVFSAVLASGAAAGSLTDAGVQARRTGSRIAAGPVAETGPGRPAGHSAGPGRTAADDGKGRRRPGGRGRGPAPGGADPADDTGRIAAEIADGKVGAAAVEKMVSRSGDRWSSFYTAQEYAGLQQALDGRYVGRRRCRSAGSTTAASRWPGVQVRQPGGAWRACAPATSWSPSTPPAARAWP